MKTRYTILLTAGITAALTVLMLSSVTQPDIDAATKGRLRVKMLMTQDLPDIDGKEVQMMELNLQPGAGSPAHIHPGHTMGYVIEGEFEVQLDDDEPTTFTAGQVFYEPSGSVHTVGRNPSSSKITRVIVFMLKDEDKPATSFPKR